MPTEHEVSFEFPYDLSGGTAAYFNCRCRVRVEWGRKPVDGDVIDEVFGLEIDIGKYDPETKKCGNEWALPDPALAQRIYDWLNKGDMQDWLMDKAREDKMDTLSRPGAWAPAEANGSCEGHPLPQPGEGDA